MIEQPKTRSIVKFSVSARTGSVEERMTESIGSHCKCLKATSGLNTC